MGIWLLIASAFAQDTCPDPTLAAQEAEAAVLEARLQAAQEAIDRAETAFACSPPATTKTLSTLWLAEGVLLSLSGDSAGAADSFAAAGRIDATHWNSGFGPALRKEYEAAIATETGTSSLRIEPAPKSLTAFLNGEPTPQPIDAPSGLNLVQVGTDQQARFARIIYLPPSDTVVLNTGLNEADTPAALQASPVPPEPTAPTASPDVRTRKSSTLLLASTTLAAFGGASMALALNQNQAMQSATDIETLDDAFSRQVWLSRSSYTLFSLSAAGIALHFTL